MLRIVLAFAVSLLALPVFAQTDPRSNTGGTAPEVVGQRASGATGSARVVGIVQVGEHAPDFSLQSAAGGEYRLRQSRGHWTALFFTDRREDLSRLTQLSRTLDSLGFVTIVVLNEKVQSLAQWRATSRSSLTALADERGEITAMYGLWDSERGETRHGLYVLDPQGVVKLALLGQKVSPPSVRGLVQTAVEGL